MAAPRPESEISPATETLRKYEIDHASMHTLVILSVARTQQAELGARREKRAKSCGTWTDMPKNCHV
ncbi:hypothetical protein PDE_03333 [Penicillium oxalicum 114-2]|uniref:Uncharacterized protein n=1 Tax=Penicillium oxalicum (strain 114-2 / CGMCC 5302) TaxID=933388 RepID=S8B1Y6_PENO1|nr:hypothetical protein PDE_03333 [Penicillium oxalicum 114-2]